ncbi:hypothetical protein Pyrfu_1563 [Pyrolobus fumarii 1A]|uniref:DUF2070 domain-containing protein n=1 Tax=Pyrolobus fumarii (strain DSM 11204 / 1A) TaxID=694429 RepID=G0EC50_PYRF1|nr:DUF2070 family protein [Pyrolobus fumarii]AEM39420.1 hypothetical protein Pyrfu_1563 [Pyrolobus fumarii 1A]
MSLRGKAVQLYNSLVRSPPRLLLAPLVAIHALLVILYPVLIVPEALVIVAYLLGFGLCSRHYMRRAAGVLLYATPYMILYAIVFALGLRPLVSAITAPFALLVSGLCGVKTAMIYVIIATVVSFPLGLIESLAAAASGIIAILVPMVALGLRGIEVARAAILAWADDNYEPLETVISGEERRVKWHALMFKRDDEKLVLIVPGVHYGPFRGAGSSHLPRMLMKYSRDKVIPLHGCGSHELNIVSRKEAEAYAQRLVKEALVATWHECKPLTPTLVNHKSGWNALAIGCVERPTVILWNRSGTEDIPCSTLEHLDDKLMIVDAHNVETESVDTRGLHEVVNSLLSKIEECKGSLRCCWRLVRVDNSVVDEAKMCDNWILVLKVLCDNNGVTMVIFPANNVDPLAARKYTEVLGSRTVLITIDDHSCAAVINEGVAPLKWSEKLAKILQENVKMCVPGDCRISYASGFDNLRVWGEHTIQEIRHLLERGVRAKALPLVIYVLFLIAALIGAVIRGVG